MFTKDDLTPEYCVGWIKSETTLNLEAFDETLRVPLEKQDKMHQESVNDEQIWKKLQKEYHRM